MSCRRGFYVISSVLFGAAAGCGSESTEGSDPAAQGCTRSAGCVTADGFVGVAECTGGVFGTCAHTAMSTQSVSEAGGRYDFGSAWLDVPEGSLGTSVEIEVTAAAEAVGALNPLSDVIRFDPAGLPFQRPAVVSFRRPEGAERPAIFWSESDSNFQPLETREVGTRLEADIERLGAGLVAETFGGGDAGVQTDAGDEDAGPREDAGPIADGGPVDVGPPDGGAVDSGTDAGAADTGAQDVGPADSGPSDSAVGPTPLTILNESIPDVDSCVEARDTLRASRPGPLEWEQILDSGRVEELTGFPLVLTGPAVSLDPSTGALTFAPNPRGLSTTSGFAVRVRDPADGAVAEAGWAVTERSVSVYAVDQGGGPVVFERPTIPDVSQTPPNDSIQIANFPASEHPCPVEYVIESVALCPGSLFSIPIFALGQDGVLDVLDPIFDDYETGRYCVEVRAETDALNIFPRLVLDGRVYEYNLTP